VCTGLKYQKEKRSGNGARQIDPDCLPGSGYFGTELRDELLNGEIFYSLKEVKIVTAAPTEPFNFIAKERTV